MEKIASFLLASFLHSIIFFVLFFWPDKAPMLDLSKNSYQVSFVLGTNKNTNIEQKTEVTEPSQEVVQKPNIKPQAPTEEVKPLPKPIEQVAEQAKELPKQIIETKKEETSLPLLPSQKPEKPLEIPKEVPVEKVKEPKPKAEPKVESKPKVEPKPKAEAEPKVESKPKAEPEPKVEPKPKPEITEKENPPPKKTAAQSALEDLLKENNTATSSALAELKNQSTANAGGGIRDVYMTQIMYAVKKEWSFPSFSREKYHAVIDVKLDPTGKILDIKIDKSSGRADFDASAVNALTRMGSLPPPPNADLQNILISFNSE